MVCTVARRWGRKGRRRSWRVAGPGATAAAEEKKGKQVDGRGIGGEERGWGGKVAGRCAYRFVCVS